MHSDKVCPKSLLVSALPPVTVSFANPLDPSNTDTAASFHYSFATDQTALATTWPFPEFSVDTGGCGWPDGPTVRKASLPVGTAVK